MGTTEAETTDQASEHTTGASTEDVTSVARARRQRLPVLAST